MPSRRLLWALLISQSMITAQQPPPVRTRGTPAIQIVEGDSAINSIRLRRSHEPVVRVIGPEDEPLAGVPVTFLLPASGPSGTFGESGLSLTISTDSKGLATGKGLRPNAIAGQFRIRVTASWRGTPLVASVSQTNAEPVLHSGRTKTIVVLAAVAAAAAAGAAVAMGGKSNSANSNSVSAP